MLGCPLRWLRRRRIRYGRFACPFFACLFGIVFFLTYTFVGMLLLVDEGELNSSDEEWSIFDMDEQYGHKTVKVPSKQSECFAISETDALEYPKCHEKMQWMEKGWKTHSCYADHGVDGTSCSFRIYLSEVEKHCPMLPSRRKILNLDRRPIPESKRASVHRNLSDLFKRMYDSKVNYDFIRSRISRLWPKWLNAYDELMTGNSSETMEPRRRLKIIIHMGFLCTESGFNFGRLSSTGGPLGELVQWSDLIAALYLLGHNLLISTEAETLRKNIKSIDYKYPCQNDDKIGLDLIFTDIIGVRYMRKKMKDFFIKIKCELRVLDSFGTHAEFNAEHYFQSHRSSLGGKKNAWGGNGLNLQQFMTMYPHTDDNTFLGFVVEMHQVDENVPRDITTLVYGKEIYMWKNAQPVIETVQKFGQIHATVGDNDLKTYLNGTVINHGILPGPELHALLRRVKIFLGLGFPLEGPAPLEAIASGAVFINPSFSQPKSRKTYAFFNEKPTLRELTSQNPYTEVFIGRPHVLTVDITNLAELKNAIREALNSKPQAYLPFEFTVLGMLQRVNTLVSRQNFCSFSGFPPREALRTIQASPYQSCQDACRQQNLRCEHSFFRYVNTPKYINRNGECTVLKSIKSPYAPYYCYKQHDPMLFSCASVPTNATLRRICPCRGFLGSESALCPACL